MAVLLLKRIFWCYVQLSCVLGIRNTELGEFNPIGFEHSGRTNNNAFTGSSLAQHRQYYFARLNYNNYWGPSTTDTQPYLELIADLTWTWHRVGTQGHSAKYVRQYTLAFEVDGEWQNYTEDGDIREFDGNTDDSTEVINDLLEPVSARRMRIYPICCTAEVEYALRVEAYGVINDLPYGDVGTTHGGFIHTNSYYASSGTISQYVKIGQYSGSWQPDPVEGSWLAIDLGTRHRLYGYAIEGLNSGYVTKFQFEYSTDRGQAPSTWICVERDGSCANFTATVYTQTRGSFPTELLTRHIRVLPLEYETSCKLKIGYNGFKKVVHPRIAVTEHQNYYTTSSNAGHWYLLKPVYLPYNLVGHAWGASSPSDDEWAQVLFLTVYDVSYIRYRGKLSNDNWAAKYFKLLTGTKTPELDLECIKEPGETDCKVYYNAENAVVVSENELLDSGDYVQAKYIRIQQIEPVDSGSPNFYCVMAVHGYTVPKSCPEAQIRYGFPDSGLFWLDFDGTGTSYDPQQFYCDMSTVPAAILLSHNQEGNWLHSKGHQLHIEHVDTVEYSLDHDVVEDIVDNSLSCEMPFEAHGRSVSLRSAYWRKEENSWRSTSFRNVEDDREFIDVPASDTSYDDLMSHVAGMWTMEPPRATETGRRGNPRGAAEIRPNETPGFSLEQGQNPTNGSFSVFAVMKILGDNPLLKSRLIGTVSNKEKGHFALNHISKYGIELKLIHEEVSKSIGMEIPLNIWMSLAVSYDHTTGVAKLIRDCQHVETQDIGPNLMFEIERLYIGRVNEVGGVNTHFMVSDTVFHFDTPMDEQMCEDVLSMMDDPREFGNIEKIRDCSDLLDSDEDKPSGVYKIHPYRSQEGIYVYCDLETDGGGWTKIYKRSSAKLDLDKLWVDYRHGIGSVDGDHFLGLENMHRITTSARYEFRVEATDYANNDTQHLNYDHFVILPETDDYAVNIGYFNDGDLPDAAFTGGATWNKQGRFTTRDRGGTSAQHNCLNAYALYAAFGLDACFHQVLFGQYIKGTEDCQYSRNCPQWEALIWGVGYRHIPWRMIELKIRRIGDAESFPLLAALGVPNTAHIGNRYNSNYPPTNARMMTCSLSEMTDCCFISPRHIYVAADWFQLDLGQVYIVTAIGTQCRIVGGHTQCWSTYELRYSLDTKSFTCYGSNSNCERLTTGHSHSASERYKLSVINLDEEIIKPARYVRLTPTTCYSHCSTTLEFYVKHPSDTEMPESCHVDLAEGAHTIYPRDQNQTVDVFCEGDWTIVMRRTAESSGFDTATLQDYIDGINTDEMDGDFWLGLHTLYTLTRNMPHTMRIELTDSSGLMRSVDYEAVKVLSAENGYALRAALVDVAEEEIVAEYIGCYIDDEPRALEHFALPAANYRSIQLCMEYCMDSGYAYFGLQNYGQCFCGMGYDRYGEAQDADCNTPCGDNNNQTCGGSWRNSVYKLTHKPQVTYHGCWDKDAMDTEVTLSEDITVDLCVDECQQQGYSYAGLYDESCWCSNDGEFGGEDTEEESKCDDLCAGNQEEMCGGHGGSGGMSIYTATLPVVRSAGHALSLTNRGFVEGCGTWWWLSDATSDCSSVLTGHYPSDDSTSDTDFSTGINWNTFQHRDSDKDVITNVVIKIKPSSSRYAGSNLPSYAFSGVYQPNIDCHASNAYLYSDGLLGEGAWCPPTAEAREDYYLQIDLKNHFYINSVITQGLSSGFVTKYRLYLSANNINYTCYLTPGLEGDCETIVVDPSLSYDYQNIISIMHVEPVRYVRIEPVEFVDYPKLRVDFLLEVDRSHGSTWRSRWFSMYGGLIDSVRRRNHPVTEIHLGSTSDGLSTLDYRLPGPLRCYSAYRTCEEVKAAGLSSGTYWLDPDGVSGSTAPFPVECVISDGKAMGVVYPDRKKMTAVANVAQALHYGEGTDRSLAGSTDHLEELMSLAGWNEQYMRYETSSSSESTYHWYWRYQGTTHNVYYYPNSLYQRWCNCEVRGACSGTTQVCPTYITGDGTHIVEGYLLALVSSLKLPVTEWIPNTNGGLAEFGALNMWFDDPYRYVYMPNYNNYNYLGALALCHGYGHTLATFDQLHEANKRGFDSKCYYGWVQEGMAYSIVRPRLHTNALLCFNKHENGVFMRSSGNAAYQGPAFCYTGHTDARRPANADIPITASGYSVAYEDYDELDFCGIHSPCRSESTCTNDKLHQYFCMCLDQDDFTRNCTKGLESCSVYQTLYNGVSGYYHINPTDDDGDTQGSFEVYCDMSRVPPLTVLENNAGCGYKFQHEPGKQGHYSQEVNVTYRQDLSDEQFKAFMDSSSFCYQQIEFHSYNSPSYSAKYKYGTTSLTEYYGAYWECDCYPSCNPTHRKCSTYDKAQFYKEDTLTITDRSKLPIRDFYVGQVDEAHEMVYIRVSHLQCITDHAYPTCYHYEVAGYTTPGYYTMGTGDIVYCDMQGYTEAECADGWVTGDATCYLLLAYAATQSAHRESCQDEGADLVAINSEEELVSLANVPPHSTYEVRIGIELADIPEGENIAVNKPAQQYDRYANADANDAPAFVDGNINSIMHSNSYSTTGWWFYVDLGRIGPVSYIVIYNRPGLYWRTRGFKILGSDDATLPPNQDVGTAWFEIVDYPGTMNHLVEGFVTVGTVAQYIGIFFPQLDEWVNMAELEVYEHISPLADTYVWYDGSTEHDYNVWGTNRPSSSRLSCATWGINQGMVDWSCTSADRAAICEKELIIITEEEIDSDTSNHTSNILDSLTTWEEMTPMEHCDGIGPCASSPCLNNGTCSANHYLDRFTCDCLDGFLGDRCEIPRLCPFESFPENTNVTVTLLNGNVYELANEEALIDGYEASVYNYTVGSRFSYNCYSGILVQGSAHRTCGADMKWSGREPRCGELSSCIDYQLRCYPSGMYELDFDGHLGPLPSVNAYCDMSTTPPTTIIHTTNPCDNKVQGHRESKNYTMEVKYAIQDEFVTALIDASYSCSQRLQFDCYKNMMWQNYAWVGRDNSTQNTYYDTSTGACECLTGRRCAYYWHSCNCDYNDYYWRQDVGYITEKDKLPIRRVLYGGQTTDLSLGFHQVGDLQCQQAYATCADYEAMGYSEGYAWIDSDGIGGAPAVYVLCDYGSDTITFTHNYPWTTFYYSWAVYGHQYQEPFSWTYDYTYAPNNPQDINTFLQTAKSAQQTITYMCLNSFLYYDGIQYGGWAGPDGEIQESFAGTPENGPGCSCGNDGSCQYGVICNCANVWLNWRWLNDEAIITRAELLPITDVYIGRLYYDHGSYYRSGRMFLGQLTAQVENMPTTTIGGNCSADALVCVGQCQCQESNGRCINTAVNDDDMILNTLTTNCSAKNPCELSISPCQNSGECKWDPWTEERYYCVCQGNWGGLSCEIEGAVNGGWGDWSDWGSCEGTCGNGTQTRNKTCNNPEPRNNGAMCGGSSLESQICDTQTPCPIDGEWSGWADWGSCSVTCAQGVMERVRTCDEPAPEHGGEDCVGNSTETDICSANTQCPVDGGWSNWGNWTDCSATCENGTTTRERECNNPVPLFNGTDCAGNDTEIDDCFLVECPINGNWSIWSNWTDCSVTCEDGIQTRNRSCTEPPPQYGGDNCPDANATIDIQICHNVEMCPVNGGWSNWTNWSNCSETCNNGTTTRIRACDSPEPEHGGTNCTGHDSETERCFLMDCPIHGTWAGWSPWTQCSVTCENGTQARNRTCTDPAPKFDGDDCPDANKTEDIQGCHNPTFCPVNGTWSEWTEWTNCSDSCGTDCVIPCGNGTMQRYRNCSQPLWDGHDCIGESLENETCALPLPCRMNTEGGDKYKHEEDKKMTTSPS